MITIYYSSQPTFSMGSFARPNWTPEEISKLRELCESGLYPSAKIAEMLGRPLHGIRYKGGEQGIVNRYAHRLYSHDQEFFSRITPETCYWAGIMTTDGCLSYNRGRPVLNLTAGAKDEAHVVRFKEAVKATNPIKTDFRKCNLSTRDTETLHECRILNIDACDRLFSDLSTNFGITPNKTLRGEPPKLPSLYHQLCFMRGYIDGDGTITCSKQPGAMVLQVCGCNREMIAHFKALVDSMNLPQFNRGRPSLLFQPDDEACYYYTVRGFRAAILFEILRRLPLPRLERKWDNPRVLEAVKHWSSRADIWPPESFFRSFTTPPAL